MANGRRMNKAEGFFSTLLGWNPSIDKPFNFFESINPLA
jgi:hypothetical protein